MIMADDGYTKVEVPQGRFIGWGRKVTTPPQTVIVKVSEYDEQGGKTPPPQNNVVPQFSGTLVEDADNYRDAGTEKETIKAGELVTVTCGVANLRKGIKAAEPRPGDTVKLVYNDQYDTAEGKGKVIEVFIKRGADDPDAVSEEDL
jgi:hypothetical protein